MKTTYPEHDKLRAVKNESQAQGAFLDWLLNEKQFVLAANHVHSDDGCGGRRRCHRADELDAVLSRIESLLAEFHGVDLRKLEDEKLAMLEECRR